MRQGTFSYSWNKPSRWKALIESDEDSRWDLVTNGKEYGLMHKCQKRIQGLSNTTGGFMSEVYACSYCRTKAPDGLVAVLKLYMAGVEQE